jgi:hypothetical protein
MDENTTSVQNVSPKQARIIAVVFVLISIGLLSILVDKGLNSALIGISEVKTKAIVTEKKIAKGKSGRSYLVSYSFSANEKTYTRKGYFGLFNLKTELRSNDYNSLDNGSEIDVVYSKINPVFNKAINDPYINDKNIFMIIGVVVFCFIGISILKRKGVSQ